MKASNKEFFRDNEKIAVIHSVWSPKLEKHSHDFYEIAFITKGSGFHVLNSMRHPIESGALFLITPKSEHTLISSTKDFEWINVLFFPSIINPSLLDIANTSDILKTLITSNTIHYTPDNLSDIELQSNNQDIRRIFEEMLLEFQQQKAGYQNLLKGYLEVLLVKIFRAYSCDSSPDMKIAQKVVNLLYERSFQDDFNINELAKKVFYSPQYFRKLFKQETGVPLSTYIRKKRLEYAKQLLETTDLSIMKIMEKSGFNDTKSFYAAFKKTYGKTPASIRSK